MSEKYIIIYFCEGNVFQVGFRNTSKTDAQIPKEK